MAELPRRHLIQAGLAGTGATALVASGCPMAGAAREGSPQTFGRLFPHLPPFAANTVAVRTALLELGAPGGPLDAKDDLFGPDGGPVKLITDPALSAGNPNNPHDTAGLTFVGQFLDHDITFDAATTALAVKADPARTPNARRPRLDLDSVYGAGPWAQPELYDPADPVKLRVESGGQFEDLPRDAAGTAIIGDPRNDSNLVLSGLHAAFLLFHNRTVDATRRAGDSPRAAYRRARELTTWHWQWLVVNRLLPGFVGRRAVRQVLRHGARLYDARRGGDMPVEFSGAAYRFGHSLIRPSYRANLAGDGGNPFFGLIFDSRVVVPDGQQPLTDPGDLRGGFRAPRRFIGWQTFFDFGGAHSGDVRTNKVIDTRLSTPLFALPASAIVHKPDDLGPVALPQRTLLRHLTWSLPSGQHVAMAMGMKRLARGDLKDFAPYGLDRSTPLWLYLLREAELVRDGQFLGPLGGRLVAETVLGLLLADRSSYLNRKPRWTPTLGPGGRDYDFASFFRFAGVDPDSRGQ